MIRFFALTFILIAIAADFSAYAMKDTKDCATILKFPVEKVRPSDSAGASSGGAVLINFADRTRVPPQVENAPSHPATQDFLDVTGDATLSAIRSLIAAARPGSTKPAMGAQTLEQLRSLYIHLVVSAAGMSELQKEKLLLIHLISGDSRFANVLQTLGRDPNILRLSGYELAVLKKHLPSETGALKGLVDAEFESSQPEAAAEIKERLSNRTYLKETVVGLFDAIREVRSSGGPEEKQAMDALVGETIKILEDPEFEQILTKEAGDKEARSLSAERQRRIEELKFLRKGLAI
jgi:hypothetical protein